MKKRNIILLIAIFISASTYSQENQYPLEGIFPVEGYYIIRYLKSEILHKEENCKLKEEGKQYDTMIDYITYPYFFTIQVNNEKKMDKDKIPLIISSNDEYKNVEIYKFPPYYSSDIKNLFNDYHIKISKEDFLIEKNKVYYELPNDNLYLYQVCFLQGYVLRTSVNMDWDINLSAKWGVNPSIINKNLAAFYIYHFYEYSSDWKNPPLGFIQWQRIR